MLSGFERPAHRLQASSHRRPAAWRRTRGFPNALPKAHFVGASLLAKRSVQARSPSLAGKLPQRHKGHAAKRPQKKDRFEIGQCLMGSLAFIGMPFQGGGEDDAKSALKQLTKWAVFASGLHLFGDCCDGAKTSGVCGFHRSETIGQNSPVSESVLSGPNFGLCGDA